VSAVQLLRAQVPREPQVKSVGHDPLAAVQGRGAQRWSLPHFISGAQSLSPPQPGWHPLPAGQEQATGSQIDGAAASPPAQSVSRLQGCMTARQAPPQT
jgi:hypothetical protein